jgi:hypothetical protein
VCHSVIYVSFGDDLDQTLRIWRCLMRRFRVNEAVGSEYGLVFRSSYRML